MGPEAWRAKIGESAWMHLHRSAGFGTERHEMNESGYELLADVLTAATEIGFRAPEQAPQVSPQGTKVLWPGPNSTVTPVLTAEGLWRHWRSRGHGFLLLRAEQLLSAVAGPLLPRLQEALFAYEEQCRQENVAVLPKWARLAPFVGGADGRGTSRHELWEGLYAESPKVDQQAVIRKSVGVRDGS